MDPLNLRNLVCMQDPNTIPDSKPPITPPQDLSYTTLTTTLIPLHKWSFINAPVLVL
ncbi:hypothetical protein JB92DRAFT_1241245 [Gautieria morchelliformis]|nr:hypothetical protein JB92DRAFT_1241245 [Gautieria morchelliformis]